MQLVITILIHGKGRIFQCLLIESLVIHPGSKDTKCSNIHSHDDH